MDKDVREKNCLSDNERYADLINSLLLEGEQIVKPEDLYELDTQLSVRSFCPDFERKTNCFLVLR